MKRSPVFTRRVLIQAAAAAAILPVRLSRANTPSIEVITAPSNLGLRPPKPGHEPGTWRAPEALSKAGLLDQLGLAQVHALARPHYDFDPQAGTRIRNGHTIRSFSESLANEVAASLSRGAFPLVLGGDCSILLGCVLGARRTGVCGLVHVDGHSDFNHPGNYDAASRLGAVAGMDLALVSGRGEPLLADWGPGLTPLVADEHIVQIGERDDGEPDYSYPDIRSTRIRRLLVQPALVQGMEATALQAIRFLQAAHLERSWLHIDTDVLDQKVMPAVDSPGSPGLNFEQLATLIQRLRASGQIIGANVSVFDPELDPDGRYARSLAKMLARGFGPPLPATTS